MLVVVPKPLEGEIEQLCTNGPLPALRGITNLLQAHADGRHIVVAPPSLCRFWEACGRLSEEQRAIATKIRLRYSELAALQQILALHAQIALDGATPTFTDPVWTIPLSWIAANDLSETHLVCEDLYDCTISHEAARDYLAFSSLSKLQLRLDHTAGGGGNTHRVLRREALISQKICVCVVDSDRDEPSTTATLGPTAQNCLQVLGQGVYEVLMTKGRELENHLPSRLVDKIRPLWRGQVPSAAYTQLENAYQGITLYADLKAGLKRKNVEGLGGLSRTYWEGAMVALGQVVVCCAGACGAAHAGGCQHTVLEPLNTRLLRDAGEYLETNAHDLKRHRGYLPSPNEAFWKEMGKVVAAYGVSVKVSPTI